MNKILLTSLALFTFVNYNNSSASVSTEVLGNMDISGKVNLENQDGYEIVGTCSVKNGGELDAKKKVTISNDGILSISGSTGVAGFRNGLIVNGGGIDMSGATGTGQLHIVDKIELKGSPTFNNVSGNIYASNYQTKNTAIIKVAGLTGKISGFVLAPTKDPDLDSKLEPEIAEPTVYLDYNSMQGTELDGASLEILNSNKTTLRATLASLFDSTNGYLKDCDLSNYHIKDYVLSEPSLAINNIDTDYTVDIADGEKLLDDVRDDITSIEKKPNIVEPDSSGSEVTSSDVFAQFLGSPSNESNNSLTGWPSSAIPLSYSNQAGTTVGDKVAEIKLNLISSSTQALKLSDGGVTETLKLSGNNSGLQPGIELYGALKGVEFNAPNSVTDIDYSNVNPTEVSMKFIGNSGSDTLYTLSSNPKMNEDQKLIMTVGERCSLTFGGGTESKPITYDISGLNMTAAKEIVVNQYAILNL